MDTIRRDLRYALRTLKKSPGFASVAILSLALGIGANTAIFSIYNAFFLRSLPVEAPEELVDLYTGEEGFEFGPFSYPDYLDMKDQTADIFSGLVAYDISIAVIDQDDGSEFLFGEAVSGNYFSVLGIEPEQGRVFIEGTDDLEQAIPVAVVSNESWRGRFGADPDLLGKTLRLNGVEYTVVGIAHENFRGMLPMSAEFWVPITHDPMIGGGMAGLESRDSRFLFSVKGRLIPGVSFEKARTAIATVGERLAQTYPETNEDSWMTAMPTSDVGIHAMLDRPLRLLSMFLMIVVGLALLVACTNLASMLLARATARRKEIAVRLALGSGRVRLIRQLVTESVLLAAAGGIIGLVIAFWLIRALMAFQPPIPIPINLHIQLDAGVLAFSALLTLVTGIIFGLIPALQTTKPGLTSALKGEISMSGGPFHRLKLRSVLVVAQVTVSALLLVCTGLFIRSLANANNVNPGFNLKNGTVTLFETAVRDYSDEEGRAFYTELKSRIAALPGVESVALVGSLPLGAGVLTTTVIPELPEIDPEYTGVSADMTRIDEDYFDTMGIGLISGRSFELNDTPGARPVAIINETLGDRLWPGEEALGRRFTVRSDDEIIWEVVGIAQNGKYRTLGENPRAFVYLPYSQSYTSRMSMVTATSIDPGSIIPAIQNEVRVVDPKLPIFEIKTIADHLELMLFLPRLIAALLGGLGLLALALGVIGLYGVISFDVARRTREVGIRMALGAERARVLKLVIGEGLKLVTLGVVFGLGIAFLVTRLLASQLFGISPTDPITFGGIAMLLFGVAVIAAYFPARRASSLNPMVALRYEPVDVVRPPLLGGVA